MKIAGWVLLLVTTMAWWTLVPPVAGSPFANTGSRAFNTPGLNIADGEDGVLLFEARGN